MEPSSSVAMDRRSAGRRVYETTELFTAITHHLHLKHLRSLMLLEKGMMRTVAKLLRGRTEERGRMGPMNDSGCRLYWDAFKASQKEVDVGCPLSLHPTDIDELDRGFHSHDIKTLVTEYPNLDKVLGRGVRVPAGQETPQYDRWAPIGPWNSDHNLSRAPWVISKSNPDKPFDEVIVTIQTMVDFEEEYEAPIVELPAQHRWDDYKLTIRLSVSVGAHLGSRHDKIERIAKAVGEDTRVRQLRISQLDDSEVSLTDIAVLALGHRSARGNGDQAVHLSQHRNFPMIGADLARLLPFLVNGCRVLSFDLPDFDVANFFDEWIDLPNDLIVDIYNQENRPSSVPEFAHPGPLISLSYFRAPYCSLADVQDLGGQVGRFLRTLDLTGQWDDDDVDLLKLQDFVLLVEEIASAFPSLRSLLIRLTVRADDIDLHDELDTKVRPGVIIPPLSSRRSTFEDRDSPVSGLGWHGFLDDFLLIVNEIERCEDAACTLHQAEHLPWFALAKNAACLCHSLTIIEVRDEGESGSERCMGRGNFGDLVHWLLDLSPKRRDTFCKADTRELGLYPLDSYPRGWRDLRFDEDDEPIPVQYDVIAEEIGLLRRQIEGNATDTARAARRQKQWKAVLNTM